MIVCPLPLRVVEREAIVPGTGDDENNAADLPVTSFGYTVPSLEATPGNKSHLHEDFVGYCRLATGLSPRQKSQTLSGSCRRHPLRGLHLQIPHNLIS
jgi:hypothetical protein